MDRASCWTEAADSRVSGISDDSQIWFWCHACTIVGIIALPANIDSSDSVSIGASMFEENFYNKEVKSFFLHNTRPQSSDCTLRMSVPQANHGVYLK